MSTKDVTPQAYGIPAHFQHWVGDCAEDHNGPFFFTVESDGQTESVTTAFRVRPENCNAHKTLHGGILMMFADYTLCIAAIGGSHEAVVTVTCNNEFVGPAFEGDLVIGRGEVTRKGGSLIFVRAVIEVDGKPVLTSSGVVKRVKRRES
ncbi:PaaI family thioesterase [Gammaproteobacteria bacterium LSUCC0112]|nr:PaaI family thioesterase [Gammaproteobacteria bacterium LSUCC0112]